MDLDQARPYIDAALDYSGGTHDFEDIRAGVASGQFQFWPGVNSAVITEIIDYPKFRAIHFFLAGGNAAELERMVPVIEKWGAEHGCTRATFTGRKGWERAFPARMGYRAHAVSFMRDISNG